MKTLAGKRLQNVGLFSVVPHLLLHGTSVFTVSPKGTPLKSPLTFTNAYTSIAINSNECYNSIIFKLKVCNPLQRFCVERCGSETNDLKWLYKKTTKINYNFDLFDYMLSLCK